MSKALNSIRFIGTKETEEYYEVHLKVNNELHKVGIEKKYVDEAQDNRCRVKVTSLVVLMAITKLTQGTFAGIEDEPEIPDWVIENTKVISELSEYERDLYTTWIQSVEYQKLGNKTVVAFVTLYNGWEFVGKAHALDPEKFEMGIGKLYSLKDALSQLDGLAGFHRYIREKG